MAIIKGSFKNIYRLIVGNSVIQLGAIARKT